MIFIISMYAFYWIMAAVGLTVGFHRCISHKQIILFPPLEAAVIWAGTIASGCSPLSWAGVHRMHHAYADTEKDPHSPKYKSWLEILFSTYRIKKIPRRFVKDLYENPRVVFFHRNRLYTFIATYAIALSISPVLVLYFISLVPLSFICYGLLNLLGHDDDGARNRWWINAFAPFEGNHYDHHEKKR